MSSHKIYGGQIKFYILGYKQHAKEYFRLVHLKVKGPRGKDEVQQSDPKDWEKPLVFFPSKYMY